MHWCGFKGSIECWLEFGENHFFKASPIESPLAALGLDSYIGAAVLPTTTTTIENRFIFQNNNNNRKLIQFPEYLQQQQQQKTDSIPKITYPFINQGGSHSLSDCKHMLLISQSPFNPHDIHHLIITLPFQKHKKGITKKNNDHNNNNNNKTFFPTSN